MKNPYGSILYVDLDKRTTHKKEIPEEWKEKYIGGRGINVRLLFDEAKPGIDALSSENPLIFGAGLLSATKIPCPARFNITAKSPLTGIVGDTNAGGHFGPTLKRTGIDHIVFRGKASEPVYLFIDNDKIEIRPAHKLWGKNIRETETLIKEELGDKRIRVAAIGQAGENLVRFANVIHEERSASRTGMGAVMGSKNLKAVAVRGTGKVELFDEKEFNKRAMGFQKAVATSDEYDPFKKRSASAGVYVTDKYGFLAVKNFQKAGGFEGIENFNPQKVAEKYYHGSVHCFGCPIGCGKKFKIKDGPFAGEWGVKIEEGAFGPLGPVCGNSNMDSIFKMNNMANQLGLDLHEFGQAVSVLMELYEKGIISEKDVDGIPLKWGDHEAMRKMMEKIAFREGIGDILAEGIVRSIKHFGKEAEKYVSHSKGMVLPALDPRMMKGSSLGLATSTRGADHLRGLVMCEFMPVMSAEQAKEKFGTEKAVKINSYEKASAVIYYQHLALLPDLFEICRFIFGLGAGTKSFSYDNLTEIYTLATGVNADEKHMHTVAERIYNLERAFACREGMGRKEDHLVGKWAKEPVPNGPYEGEKIDPEKWEIMLDDYYRLRGWNSNGVPGRRKLTELGLEDVAEEFENLNIKTN